MRYRAPWSGSVKWITGGVIVFFTAIPFFNPWAGAIAWSVILALLAVGPSGYSFEGRDLVVHRRLWSAARVALGGLRTARIAPDVTRWSFRTFGNGGVFGFTGWFRNSRLGAYRAWVTDPKRTVVLEFEDRVIVISPGRPHLFVDELRERTGIEASVESESE